MERAREAERRTAREAHDPVGTALAGIGAGAATGGAVITAGALGLRLLQARAGNGLDADTGAVVLTVSAFLGLAAAATTGWVRTHALQDTWRRGVAAGLAAFGAVLLAVLATPADMLGGVAGLGAYVVVLLAALITLQRRAAAAGS